MYNIDELRIFYKSFLDDLCKGGLDADVIASKDNFIDWAYANNRKLDFFFSFGASKMVLWEDEMPYVLKIPFLNDVDRDYCKIEIDNYKKAEKIPEIAECFAWCDYLFELFGFPIYIMEKANCDEGEISEQAYSSAYEATCEYESVDEEKFSEDFYYWSDIEQMENLLCDEWTWRVFDKFLHFCEKNNINDRHTGNWGYIGDRLVIVDYSGY